LKRWPEDNTRALDEALPHLYVQLRRIAHQRLRAEYGSQTLQTTALVHEAYLKLRDQRGVQWRNRTQFYAIAARMMRRILVDHARTVGAQKRGGDAVRVTVSGSIPLPSQPAVDLLALDSALDRLGALSPRQAHMVELHFFAGFKLDETADALGISLATVKREWTLARAFLYKELSTAQ
jgi:RNA polymerase sigma factor (TIGR02999 family)